MDSHKSMGPVEEVSANRGIEQDNLNDLALWAADIDLKLQSINQESFNNRAEQSINPDESEEYGAAVQAQS